MDTVTFGTKNSYTDFGLILSSKEIGIPRPKTKDVNVPGMDGKLDLTDVLTEEVKFENRKLQFTFTVVDHFNGWSTRLSQVMNYLHGEYLKIQMDWDFEYYYMGRCTVNKFKSNKRTGTIVIDVDAEPWKYDNKTKGGNSPWTWDDFNFINGEIRPLTYQTYSSPTYITIENGRKPCSPTIHTTNAVHVEVMGHFYDLSAGQTKTLTEVLMVPGTNSFRFIGNSEVTITFKGGSL